MYDNRNLRILYLREKTKAERFLKIIARIRCRNEEFRNIFCINKKRICIGIFIEIFVCQSRNFRTFSNKLYRKNKKQYKNESIIEEKGKKNQLNEEEARKEHKIKENLKKWV